MQDLGTSSFIDAITHEDIVVIDFWAECEPCRAFESTFDDAAKRHGDVAFAKVDTEANPELAAALDINAIPTLMVFRESILVFRRAGGLPLPVLDDVLEQVRALDMGDVRRHLEGPMSAPR
jgi:thioredoxin-like negative regulator of GroEL